MTQMSTTIPLGLDIPRVSADASEGAAFTTWSFTDAEASGEALTNLQLAKNTTERMGDQDQGDKDTQALGKR